MKKLLISILCIAMITVFMPTMAFAENVGSATEVVYLDGTASENGNGTEASPYNDFDSAMAGVQDGGTIKLLNNLDKEFTDSDVSYNKLVINKNITLDLDKKAISIFGENVYKGIAIDANKSVTIKNGEIHAILVGSDTDSNAGIYLGNKGNLSLQDCVIDVELKNEKGSAVKLEPISSLNAEGCTFSISGKESFGIKGDNIYFPSGDPNAVTLSDCTVEASNTGIELISSDMKFEDTNVTGSGEYAYHLKIQDGNEAVISGGEINGDIRLPYDSKGTLKISGHPLVNGQIDHVGNGTNNKASRINIAGGKFALTENLIKTNLKDNITVSGGFFKNEDVIRDFVKDPYKIVANIGADGGEYPYTIQNIPEGTVACVGNKTYSSLEEAMTAAGNNTVLLMKDVETDTLYGKINGNGKTITYKGTLKSLAESGVTLTNAKVICSDANIGNMSISESKLTGGIVNSGNVNEFLAEDCFVNKNTDEIEDVSVFEATIGKIGYPYLINATTAAAQTAEKEIIVIQKDQNGTVEEVMPNANYTLDLNGHVMGGFLIVPNMGNTNLTPNNADITIIDSSEDKTGRIVSEDNFAVATNGTLENIRLTLDGITVESKVAAGIYFPSSGKLTVKDSNVIGVSGIEIRGGKLEIENTNITATADEFKANKNSNGSTIEGAAIAVSQHTTNHDIDVNIKSGTFKGVKALYETDLQDDQTGNINISVDGGKFDGEVESDNVARFIKGGIFTEWPGKELVASKALAIQKGDNFYIGDDADKIIEAAQPGDKIIVLNTGEGSLTVPEGVIVENKSGHDITVNGKELANGEIVTASKPEFSDDDNQDKPKPPIGNNDFADGDNGHKPENHVSPETGDESDALPFILLAVTAAAMGTIAALRRREG